MPTPLTLSKKQERIEFLRSEIDHIYKTGHYGNAARHSEELVGLLGKSLKHWEAREMLKRTAELFILAACTDGEDAGLTARNLRKAVEILMSVGERRQAEQVAVMAVSVFVMKYETATAMSKACGGYNEWHDIEALLYLSSAVGIISLTGDREITQNLLEKLFKRLDEGRDRNLKKNTSSGYDVGLRYIEMKKRIAEKLSMKDVAEAAAKEYKVNWKRYKDVETRELRR